MIRLTIYRLNETIELDLDVEPSSLRSSSVYTLGRINPESGIREDIRYRPYYRRTINGVLNIFAEEEVV